MSSDPGAWPASAGPTTGAGGTLIVGLSHSGKTEVRRILETSPRVFASRHSRYWAEPDERWGPLDIPANLDACVRSLDRSLDGAGWITRPAEVAAECIAHGDVSYYALLSRMHESEARLRGSDLWCVQVGGIEPLLPDRLSVLPDLKVVHMVRDPRDRLSMSRLAPIPGRRGWDLGRWESSLHVGLECRRNFPDRYMVATWEDLIERPQSLIEELAAFVGCRLDASSTLRPSAEKRSARGGVTGPHTTAAVEASLRRIGYPVGSTSGPSPSDLVELAALNLFRTASNRRNVRRGRGPAVMLR